VKKCLIVLSVLAIAGSAQAQGIKKTEPSKAWERQRIEAPGDVVPAPAPAPLTPKACRGELKECLTDIKTTFPLKEDRDLRDGGIQACIEGYKICRGQVAAAAPASTWFDAALLADGIVDVHAPTNSTVALYSIGPDNVCVFVAFLHESAIEGEYFAEDVVWDRLGTDEMLIACSEEMFSVNGTTDEVAAVDLIGIE